MSYLKKFLIVLFFSIHLCYPSHVSINYVSSKRSDFRNYLASLSWQMSPPWAAIKVSAEVMGFSPAEIDGIPSAFPFLYEEKYKTYLSHLTSPDTVDLINQIIEDFNKESRGIAHSKKRELLHTIIHRYTISHLRLPAYTSTKQLSSMVKNKSVSIDQLCKLQVAYFFVKFHLNL
jgi:hypothetical protein